MINPAGGGGRDQRLLNPIRGLASLAITARRGRAPARGDLAPAFAGKVNVDAGYVTGASNATDIAFSGDGRAVVTRKTGQIVVRRANGTVNVVANPFPSTAATNSGPVDTASEKGLLGVVADPDVASNSVFYFYVSNGAHGRRQAPRLSCIPRRPTTPSPSIPVPIVGASRDFGPGLEGPANHDGGGLVIHNGQLYVGVGDTGANASPPSEQVRELPQQGERQDPARRISTATCPATTRCRAWRR